MNAQRSRRPSFAHPVRESARERGVTLFVATVSLVFLIPIVGLSVDVGFLYAVKARLQAAVDGSALGAARALNLGQTTSSQATAAQANAVNWFYANFPATYMGTSSTVMSTSDVQVFDDPVNPLVRNVTVQAQTDVPTYFMRWLKAFFPSGSFTATTVKALGNAARRDVVVMLVLDRSGSMNSNNGCANMKTAAKLFVGQFANGRDRVGLVTFASTTYMQQSPIQAFQAALGYTNNAGTATGLIDNITCGGWTAIATGLSLGYNELYRTNLPGALNVIMFMTDGLPNSIVFDAKSLMKVPTTGTTITSGQQSNYTPCTDSRGLPGRGLTPATRADFVNFPATWSSAVTFGSGSLFSNIAAGMVGGAYTTGAGSGTASGMLVWNATSTSNHYGQSSSEQAQTSGPGCNFPSNAGNYDQDIAYLPSTDIFGNSLTGYHTPVNYANVTGTVSANGTSQIQAGDDPTMNSVCFNASDSAGSRARTNATLPVYIFAVGLGGTVGTPADYTLLQRITNDPNGDLFNTPALYSECSANAQCVNYTNQPSGTFIFSANPTQLAQAFLKISSMILRLSR